MTELRPITPAKKKLKSSSNAFTRLIDQLSSLLASLESLDPSQESTLILNSLESTSKNLDEFEKSESRLEEESVKNELDKHGSELWNRSIKLHDTLLGIEPEQGWLKAFAILRQIAYRLIQLGTITPYSADARIKLITLSTKTALAFFALSSSQSSKISASLLEDSASYVEPFLEIPLSEISEPVEKVIANFYLTRIRISVKEKNWELGAFVMEKAKALAMGTRRYVIGLAKLSLEIGSSLVCFEPINSKEEGLEEKESNRAEIAIRWLLDSTELLENQTGIEIKGLQISVLENLAQAYLNKSNKSGWEKAETTLSELLELAPTAALWRRQIRLIIERKAGEGEMIAAFEKAFKSMTFSQDEGTMLLGEMHRISADHQSTKLAILNKLLDLSVIRFSNEMEVEGEESGSREIGNGVAGFIALCLMAIVFLISDQDQELMENVLSRLNQAAPNLQLSSNPSFLILTYLWRRGDTAHAESRSAIAAKWYLMGTNSIFRSLEEEISQKCFRKAALCFVEVGMLVEADKMMEKCAGGIDSAKNHFVRFYTATLAKNEEQAIKSLEAMSNSSDLEIKILLWAAKVARESVGSSRNLYSRVLLCVLEVGRRETNVVGVDLLVLIRTLIRTLVGPLNTDDPDLDTVDQILKHFEMALTLAKRLVAKSSRSIVMDMAWLHKTSYNLSIRLTKSLTSSTLISYYSVTAALAEFSTTLTPNPEPETLAISLHCRFASLAAALHEARAIVDTQSRIVAFGGLIPRLLVLKEQLQKDQITINPTPSINDISSAIAGLEIEIYCVMKNWEKVEAIFQEIGSTTTAAEREIKLIKIITERCLEEGSTCPEPILISILRAAPSFLLRQAALNTEAIAAWLRTIIDFSLKKNLLEGALEYFEHSVRLLEASPKKFPLDEHSWIISTSWEKGLDSITASDSTVGKRFCQIALRATKQNNHALQSTLTVAYNKLFGD